MNPDRAAVSIKELNTMTIKPIALAAAILAALTISFPTEAKSDTLSSAEEAVEEGKISDKDLDVLFDRLKDAL